MKSLAVIDHLLETAEACEAARTARLGPPPPRPDLAHGTGRVSDVELAAYMRWINIDEIDQLRAERVRAVRYWMPS